jgi:formamidopyrimidine-DNA glycosylase
MPENPEVAKQVDFLVGLFPAGLKEYNFVGLEVLSNKFPDLNLNALKRTLDLPLQDIFCKGKHFFIRLSNDVFLTAHHGMKGWWTNEEGDKNAHIKLSFARYEYTDGEITDILEEVAIWYSNQRFGKFEIGLGQDKLQDKLDALAPGFIGRFLLDQAGWDLSVAGFSPKKKVRDALMDQYCLCSGVGNYLCAEIMYVARLHPNALFSKMTKKQKSDLFKICSDVVIGHYSGGRQKQIYKQKVAPCGGEIVAQTFGQRTAHWVPTVQTLGV